MIKRKKGFTLIELLVVITIIAVLAAILFPVFLMARQKARAINCMNNLKQMTGFFAMYMADWQGVFPTTAIPKAGFELLGHPVVGPIAGTSAANYFKVNAGANMGILPNVGGYWEAWPVKLEPYVRYKAFYANKMQGVFRCKELSRQWTVVLAGGGPGDQAGYGYNFLYLGLPFRAYNYLPVTSRTYNQFHNPYAGTGGFVKGAPKQATIKNPAETICLVDSQWIWAWPPKQYTGANWTSGNCLIRPRHNNQSNIAWADGHVSSRQTDQLVNNSTQFGNGSNVNPPQIGKAADNSLWDLQ